MTFNTPSNIPRIETHKHQISLIGGTMLLTPPPTYQGLKHILTRPVYPAVNKSFNTPSNIPRIETEEAHPQKQALGAAFNTPSNIPRIETCRHKCLQSYGGYSFNTPSNIPRIETAYGIVVDISCPALLTPPPTYQGLKPEKEQQLIKAQIAFNTPSNIPRIETGS